MTSCLYECLREVGLQRHHARFTSMGVCRVAQLSTLTLEDYPVLGVQATEDCARLFHLVQLVRSVGRDGGEDHGRRPVPWLTRILGLDREGTQSQALPRDMRLLKALAWPAGELRRISVCVRKRCLTRAEDKRGEVDVVMAQAGACVLVHQSKEAVDLTHYLLQHRFYFDEVFGEQSSNEDVYQTTALPLVLHMLNGGKATCFAYGQTGAGKTHTMLGSCEGGPGLYAMAARDIFTHLHTTPTTEALLVYVSFLEIYCGQLYDLLDHRKLFAREDGKGEVQLAGLREIPVDTVESLMEVICWGTEQRTEGVSGVNPVSSRSHALLQIQLRGSERAVDSREPDRQTRREGAEINQSLLALKECIRSLDREQSHTPFRQSKLTQVLKDSFVGNSKTCMIANISPGQLATEHTLNTLRYADRVKELRKHGGVRPGGLRTRGTSLAKLSQTSTNTRDRSTPNRPKRIHREALGSNRPPKWLLVAGATLSSTPRDSPREKGRAMRVRGREQQTGIEHLTPVKCHRETLGPGTSSKKLPTAGGILCSTPKNCIGDWRNGIRDKEGKQDTGVGHLTPAEWRDGEQRQRVPGPCRDGDRRNPNQEKDRRERVNHIHHNIGTRQLDSQRAGLRERRDDLLKAGGREEEERHLRWYHQQLQQFTPLAALQYAHPPESSFSVSVSSSSNSPPVSASSPCSPKPALSPVVHHGLKELLNVYRAGITVQTGVCGGSTVVDHDSSDVAAPIQASPSVKFLERSESTWATGDADRARHLRPHFGQQVTADVEVSYEIEVGESIEGAGGGEGNEMGLAVEEGQERRWAWMKNTQTDKTNVATIGPLNQEVSVMSSSDSGDHWRQTHVASSLGLMLEDECSDDYWVEGRHGYRDGNRLIHQHQPSCQDPPQHLDLAERPLSPGCEPTDHHSIDIRLGRLSLNANDNNTSSNVVPPLLSPGSPQLAAMVIGLQSELGRTDFAVKCDKSNSVWKQHCFPVVTQSRDEVSSSVFNGCHEQPAFVQSSKVHAWHKMVKTCDLSPDESSVGFMDPLSLSQLEVSRQAASDSFLCGENNSSSLCLPETEEEEEEVTNQTVAAPYYDDHEEDGDGDADPLWEMSK
ncbi:hypothetical protein NHX12_028944 [Muraenolepis orangiensis]|uniref:Kinesin motor domain-containing protein n=1 Tax=Muraenolepis orangiensis TaxID=630683 RepID=A0A9Q0EEP7_9TELE|nr:hypothetical protein NHX12_028944 [Muraenolepis orangiensis]